MLLEDLTGRTFGRLKVIAHGGYRDRKTMWLCRCSCGNKKLIRPGPLKRGGSRSCGCLRSEMGKQAIRQVSAKYLVRHGERSGAKNTPELGSYYAMKNRCYQKTACNYQFYGARGIRVCRRWLGRDGYSNFLVDMGRKPHPKAHIGRKNHNKNYQPSNCRWET